MAFGTKDVNLTIGATDKTSAAFRSAETRMKSLAGSAKSLASTLGMGISVAAFTRLAKSAIEYGSAITDAAAATRVGIEEYQVLSFLAQQAGAEMGNMTTALAKIQKAANDASNGLTTYTRAFEALNIDVEEFKRLSPDQQFAALGRAMVTSKDKATAYASVLDIVGSRNAPRLMEALQKLGTDGWDAVSEKARSAGQVMAEETAVNMDKAADAIEEAKTRITNAFAAMLSGWMEFNEKIGEEIGDLMYGPPRPIEVEGSGRPGDALTDEERARLIDSMRAEAEERGLDPDSIRTEVSQQIQLKEATEKTTDAIEEQVEIVGTDYPAAVAENKSALEEWLDSNMTYQDLVMHSMEDMSSQMTSSFSSFCQDGELDFADFASSVMQNIADMVFQMTVAIPVAKALASAMVGSDGSGGILGGIGSFFGGMISGVSGANAAGGPVYGGRSYLVGEQGPEIITTKSDGAVIPNDEIGGGGTTINFNVTAVDSASFSQRLARHKQEITAIVERAYNSRGRRGPITA